MMGFNIFSSKGNNNTITINGKSISVQGNNILVINNKVYVDEKLVEEGLLGEVKISFEGDLANLDTNSSVIVNGNVSGDINSNGSVTVNGDVKGDIDCNGSVSCGSVQGSIDAMGSVSLKR